MVTNQGSTSTCVCHSLISCLDYMLNEQRCTPCVAHDFSVYDLYAVRADKSKNGMQIKDALRHLRHHGLNGTKIRAYYRVM